MKAICPVCGKEFTARVEGHAGRTKLSCSSACKWKRINRIRHGQPVAETEYRALCEKRKSAKLAARRKQLVCPVCGKAFMQAKVSQRYCCSLCQKAANNRAASRKRAEARGVRKCEWCGAEFTPKNSRARFCSHRCICASAYNQRRGAAAASRKRAEARADLDSLARVRAYLSLPPAERYARRGELTSAERALAQRLYLAAHPVRTVATNNLCH